jgi:hypothetical protein
LLEVAAGTPLPTGLLDKFPKGSVEIVEIEGYQSVDAGDPQAEHAPADVTAGIWARITDLNGVFQGRCTLGFNGHTNSFSYFVTAGHCFDMGANVPGQFTQDAEIDSVTNNFNYTTGNRYLLSNDTANLGDMARISGPDNIAGTNCMHWQANPCAWGMEELAETNSWEIGADMTCGSFGRSNKYECNTIERIDEESGGHTGLATVRIEIRPGDSGTGMHWGEAIDGLVIREDNLRFRTDRVYFHPAEDVRSGLRGTFDFNCWQNGQTNRAPNFWLASCPLVNR